jgi:hypothetical protein
LHKHNPYVQLFQQLRLLIENKPQANYIIKLLDNYAIDKRLNTPSVNEVACPMLSNDNVATRNTREFIIYPKSETTPNTNLEKTQILTELHSSYDALSYSLLLVYGEKGWQPKITRPKNNQKKINSKQPP